MLDFQTVSDTPVSGTTWQVAMEDLVPTMSPQLLSTIMKTPMTDEIRVKVAASGRFRRTIAERLCKLCDLPTRIDLPLRTPNKLLLADDREPLDNTIKLAAAYLHAKTIRTSVDTLKVIKLRETFGDAAYEAALDYDGFDVAVPAELAGIEAGWAAMGSWINAQDGAMACYLSIRFSSDEVDRMFQVEPLSTVFAEIFEIAANRQDAAA